MYCPYYFEINDSLYFPFSSIYINRNTVVAICRENMLGYLPADIICSEKRTGSSRKTVSYDYSVSEILRRRSFLPENFDVCIREAGLVEYVH